MASNKSADTTIPLGCSRKTTKSLNITPIYIGRDLLAAIRCLAKKRFPVEKSVLAVDYSNPTVSIKSVVKMIKSFKQAFKNSQFASPLPTLSNVLEEIDQQPYTSIWLGHPDIKRATLEFVRLLVTKTPRGGVGMQEAVQTIIENAQKDLKEGRASLALKRTELLMEVLNVLPHESSPKTADLFVVRLVQYYLRQGHPRVPRCRAGCLDGTPLLPLELLAQDRLVAEAQPTNQGVRLPKRSCCPDLVGVMML